MMNAKIMVVRGFPTGLKKWWLDFQGTPIEFGMSRVLRQPFVASKFLPSPAPFAQHLGIDMRVCRGRQGSLKSQTVQKILKSGVLLKVSWCTTRYFWWNVKDTFTDWKAPSWERTYPSKKALTKMIFLFPQVEYVGSLEGMSFSKSCNVYKGHFVQEIFPLWPIHWRQLFGNFGLFRTIF